jgi:hypothetical protein
LNTTEVPLQTDVPGFALIVTVGLLELLTNMVIGVEVTAVGLPHGLVIVIITVITSPLLNAALVYVLLFVPTFVPFSFH